MGPLSDFTGRRSHDQGHHRRARAPHKGYVAGGDCLTRKSGSFPQTGQLLAAKVLGGAITDFLATRPLYILTSGWHTFALRCYDSVITYLLDGSAICAASDTTFSRGYCGIGYQSHFSSNSNIHGTRADNFSAVVENVVPSPASLAIRLASGPSASLTITGSIGATYRLDFSPALPATHWTPLTNLFMSFSPLSYVDGSWSTNSSAGFYRAVSVP